MSYVDDLLHEVCHRRVADDATSNEHAIAGLHPQLTLEAFEAALGRSVDDFVIVTSAAHLLF